MGQGRDICFCPIDSILDLQGKLGLRPYRNLCEEIESASVKSWRK